MGYNPRCRGKRSYDPLFCLEGNSSFLWDTELRPANAGIWAGSEELLACCFLSLPSDIRQVSMRAYTGFSFHPVSAMLEQLPYQYAVLPRLTTALYLLYLTSKMRSMVEFGKCKIIRPSTSSLAQLTDKSHSSDR